MPTEIIYEVRGEPGYYEGLNLNSAGLSELEDIVDTHYYQRIKEISPEHANEFAAIPMERYHELSHLIDHGNSWVVGTRRLPKKETEKVKGMRFFNQLRDIVGPFDLTDQRGLGWGEMNWRIVRPERREDFGGLHSDKWFWTLTEGKIPPGKERMNIWISVHTEPGKCGLRVVPGAYGDDESIRFKPIIDQCGNTRPQWENEEEYLENFDINVLECKPGNVLIFNEDIIHGGSYNYGTTCRVSLEFTMLVDKLYARPYN